jgi:hypothetical protein
METQIDSLLKTICARTFPDVAPDETAAPFIVWQGIGGQSLRALDGDHCGARNTYMQISVWASRRLDALNLIRQVEDALISSPAFTVVRPDSEPMGMYDEETDLHGSIQRFSIWSTR